MHKYDPHTSSHFQISLICVQNNLHSWKSCECRSAQHFTMKPAPLCCCRSVCNLSPSWRPRRPAASSEPTRPPSSRGSPLWTPDTPTPGTDTRMVVRFTCKYWSHLTHYKRSYYLLEVEFLEHGDADLVVQANFHLELFDPKFGDS